jgi:hypothetical protein
VILIASVFAVMPAAGEERVGTTKDHTSVLKKAGGLSTTDMTSAAQLAQALVGSGVTVSNAKFTGVGTAAGTFTGGATILGIADGIVLSSGDIDDVVGPNTADSTSTSNGMAGDAALDNQIPGYTTYDSTVLEFEFTPQTSVLTFEYVFGSEEYNEYVNSNFNDVFGFFINGQTVAHNVALIPGTTTPVAINNVNNGLNSLYYRDNDYGDFFPGPWPINTELDGLTVVLTVTAKVNAGVKNTMKLAIADAGDYILDSDVFIKGESIVSPKLTLEPLKDTNPRGTSHTLTATLVDENGKPIPGVKITFEVTDGPHKGVTGTGVTDKNGEATWSYTGAKEGTDTIVATGGKETSNKALKKWTEEYIPEFSTIAIPVASILGLLFFFNYRKRKREQ